MAKNHAYLLPEIINPPASIYVCVPIPDDPGHRQAFAGAMLELTRWWRWERDDQHQAKDAALVWLDIFQATMAQLDQRLTSCGNETTTETECACTGGRIIFQENGQNMGNEFLYEVVGGQPLLGINCGCGDIKWFQLTPVDSPGQAIKKIRPDLMTDNPTKFLQPVSAENQSCYAIAAVDYIFSQAVEIHDFLVTAAMHGLDAYSGPIDEIFNGALFIIDMLNGANDVWSLVETSKAQVTGVFGLQTLRDDMIAHWTYTGSVTRQELDAWIEKAPNFVAGVPVKILLYSWMAYGMLDRYNVQLEMLAAECTSGYSMSTGGLPGAGGIVGDGGVGAVETTITDSNDTFPLYTWTFDPTYNIYNTGSGWVIPDVGNVIAVAYEISSSETGNLTLDLLEDGSVIANPALFTAGESHKFILDTDNQTRVMLETLIPDFTRQDTFTASDPTGELEIRKTWGDEAVVHIQKVTVICEALP